MRRIRKMRIVMLGAPGSGKGTQAKKLMNDKGISHISTGDMLRSAVEEGTQLGLEARNVMESGKLVSDNLMMGLIQECLSSKEIENGFILDGFPRTTKQAIDLKDLLEDMNIPLDSALLMDVDFEILMKRLVGRRTCSVTGKLLNVYFSSPEELEECKNLGGELIKREDDNEETIRNRLDVYKEKTEPLISYYENENLLKRVNAEGSMEDVYKGLLAAI
tara:strand:- start:1675 stop:2331 length:657 start_codon:yes stop_codon:yes gene_type:complete